MLPIILHMTFFKQHHTGEICHEGVWCNFWCHCVARLCVDTLWFCTENQVKYHINIQGIRLGNIEYVYNAV